MAIKVETTKEEVKEISFPCLMKNPDSELVVLFTNAEEGTVLNAGMGWCVGAYHTKWKCFYDRDQWLPSPPVTISNA